MGFQDPPRPSLKGWECGGGCVNRLIDFFMLDVDAVVLDAVEIDGVAGHFLDNFYLLDCATTGDTRCQHQSKGKP